MRPIQSVLKKIYMLLALQLLRRLPLRRGPLLKRPNGHSSDNMVVYLMLIIALVLAFCDLGFGGRCFMPWGAPGTGKQTKRENHGRRCADHRYEPFKPGIAGAGCHNKSNKPKCCPITGFVTTFWTFLAVILTELLVIFLSCSPYAGSSVNCCREEMTKTK